MDNERAEVPPNEVDEIEQEDPISVPNWLIEALEWIERMEMADSKLSTSSWAFNELCGPKLHGRKVKPHIVKWMWINGDEDESGILQAKVMVDHHLLQFPLPNVPPPDYILGFKEIDIRYLDARILEFFKCIAPIMNDVQFDMCTRGMREWGPKEEDKRTAMVECLLNALAHKIGQLKIYVNFGKFNQLFPAFIDQLDSLSIFMNDETDVDILYKWLTERKENEGNKQKFLELVSYEEFLRDFSVRIEQRFIKATDPINFLISFPSIINPIALEVGEFTLENEKTGEVLISYGKQIDWQHAQLLLRCPKGEEERWKEEGEKKFWANRLENATNLDVVIDKFGAFNNMA